MIMIRTIIGLVDTSSIKPFPTKHQNALLEREPVFPIQNLFRRPDTKGSSFAPVRVTPIVTAWATLASVLAISADFQYDVLSLCARA